LMPAERLRAAGARVIIERMSQVTGPLLDGMAAGFDQMLAVRDALG